jgi:hypothetical protein
VDGMGYRTVRQPRTPKTMTENLLILLFIGKRTEIRNWGVQNGKLNIMDIFALYTFSILFQLYQF